MSESLGSSLIHAIKLSSPLISLLQQLSALHSLRCLDCRALSASDEPSPATEGGGMPHLGEEARRVKITRRTQRQGRLINLDNRAAGARFAGKQKTGATFVSILVNVVRCNTRSPDPRFAGPTRSTPAKPPCGASISVDPPQPMAGAIATSSSRRCRVSDPSIGFQRFSIANLVQDPPHVPTSAAAMHTHRLRVRVIMAGRNCKLQNPRA